MNINNMFPKHLQNIIVSNTTYLYEDSMLHGELCCTCGERRFSVQIFALAQENNVLVKVYEGQYTLYIMMRCAKCGKEWLIFDYTKHGYNALVCKNGVRIPDKLIEAWRCPECRGDIFTVKISIEPEDQEQFVEDVVNGENSDMSADDYINAFGWITIALTCEKCSHEMKRWVDLETS